MKAELISTSFPLLTKINAMHRARHLAKVLSISLLVTVQLVWLPCAQAEESNLWKQFQAAKPAGYIPVLPDFSYAGYDYSESPIPDTSSWASFDVTAYGAVADDGNYDDIAIQAAIDAAEAAGGGIVFFPPGRFMISPTETVGENIFINSSNILLKGSGSGAGGTEIFKDKMKVNNGRYIFEIAPSSLSESDITTVVSDASRESYTVEVANALNLSPGQRVILRQDSVDFAQSYYSPQIIDPLWTRLLSTQGFQLRELHTVESIDGNTVRFREPLHIALKVGQDPIRVRTYNMLNNVGVEDILFKGNWDSYPEEFVHHKDDIHDYAWNALRFDNVENGWIRNVEFRDWNQNIYIDGCAAMTLENILLSGKQGHTSIHTRRSYGILIKDSQDLAGHHHGPGIGYWGTGTVYLRYQMAPGQRMDSHSGSPYATLFDNVVNGHFDGNGGPHESYPHHGKYFVTWNFLIDGGPTNYDFWPSSRNGHTFAQPYFIGLQGNAVSMVNGSFAANELEGQTAEPTSLFEAQLALRLANNNYNNVSHITPKQIINDSFADGDRSRTGELDADWWSSSQTSGSNVEIAPGQLTLVTGTSGRGMHATFSPQTLGVGDTIAVRYSFTTPATIGTNRGTAFKIALMDLDEPGLAADQSSSSSSVNPLYVGQPGYFTSFDVDSVGAGTQDTDFRKHDELSTLGRFLGTASEWNTLSSSSDAGYSFAPNTAYVGSFSITRSREDSVDLYSELRLSDGTLLGSHSTTDSNDIANHFGMLGFWVNSNTFGASNMAGTPDNGLIFTNVTIESTVQADTPIVDVPNRELWAFVTLFIALLGLQRTARRAKNS